ncbi:hypothetical protein amb1625 [Paramagnetospirillum magneticum AMB-1]|uniref:Uncharacterized protein n=1 Tax=Paramagnetospirillum magneticum (strain ATCC 700264 / AMB-1) TaxID=342108 RepID=Q2W6U6_PARM1|nr:hypothetical protein amb1625 [Paramagnetospirillum magneticum AMB-1]
MAFIQINFVIKHIDTPFVIPSFPFMEPVAFRNPSKICVNFSQSPMIDRPSDMLLKTSPLR